VGAVRLVLRCQACGDAAGDYPWTPGGSCSICGARQPWRVDQADAIEWLHNRNAGELDLMVTDPAYESLEKHRAKGTTTRLKVSDASSNAWFPIFHNDRFAAFFDATYRAMAKNSHCYMLCDDETSDVVIQIARRAGFTFWKRIVWDKVRIGMGYHYRNQHEFILFFEKGKRRLRNLGVGSVLRVPRVSNGYPTEKPVDLLRILIEQSSEPGELVADPFCGSGSTGEAALGLGRRFAGADILPDAVQRAARRLAEFTENQAK
jgi:site-specific DNA-methyltransferase (adenine-specific)